MRDRSVTDWLDFLRDLLPPSHIALVGAGNGGSPWVQWLLQHADVAPTLLLEADPAQYQILQQRLASQPKMGRFNAVCGLVAPQKGKCDFYTASLAAESGLLSPAKLSVLWSDVQTVQTHTMSATTMQEVFDNLTVNTGFNVRHLWLVIDCLPAASLLRSTDVFLSQLDVVLARVVLPQEIKSDTHACIDGAHLDEVSQLLQGMRQVALQTTRNPAIAYALFVRDYRAALQQQAPITSKATEELQIELDTEVRAKTELQEKLKQVIEPSENLEKDISAQSPLELLFRAQQNVLTNMQQYLDMSLKQETRNIIRQVEAIIGLQNYFATGGLPPINVERHAWPVSPDFAFCLMEVLECNDYDVVVEFGSGISTIMIARALSNMARHRREKAPVEFVSCEHLECYWQKTRALIERAGLLEKVQLHHAPLISWKASDGNIQPYYACQSILAALSEKYTSAKVLRILVVVDGPPSDTAKHARYPAVPIILENFPDAEIDLLLDDYIREDEQEIVQRWQDDIAIMGLNCTLTKYMLEKDACLVKIRKP